MRRARSERINERGIEKRKPPMVIPSNERYPGLKAVLFDFVDKIAKIRQDNPNLAEQQPLFFTFLTFPWLAVAEALTEDQRSYQDGRKIEIAQLGFDGERTKQILLD